MVGTQNETFMDYRSSASVIASRSRDRQPSTPRVLSIGCSEAIYDSSRPFLQIFIAIQSKGCTRQTQSLAFDCVLFVEGFSLKRKQADDQNQGTHCNRNWIIIHRAMSFILIGQLIAYAPSDKIATSYQTDRIKSRLIVFKSERRIISTIDNVSSPDYGLLRWLCVFTSIGWRYDWASTRLSLLFSIYFLK